MGGSVKLWCFILLLPFFAAISHDFYVSYMVDPEKKARLEALDIDPEAYQVSDFGYLFVTYVPDLYENSREVIGDTNWKNFVDPVLRQFTFVVGLIPVGLFLIYLALARLIGLPPYRGWRLGRQMANNSPYEGVFKDRDRDDKFKYKRR